MRCALEDNVWFRLTFRSHDFVFRNIFVIGSIVTLEPRYNVPGCNGFPVTTSGYAGLLISLSALDSCPLRSRKSAFPQAPLRLVRRPAPRTSGEAHRQDVRSAIACVVTDLAQ